MGSEGVEASEKKAMWLYPKVKGFNPSERWGHSACYHERNVYIFGGCCGGLHFSDVLALNLDTMVWNTIATTGEGPGPRDSHSAVLVGNQMIVFGGTNGCRKVNELHILDLHTREWKKPECKGDPPSSRESHTATLVGNEMLVIFGGSGEGEANYLNDLHVLDLKTMRWSNPEMKGDIPVPRDSHSAIAIGYKLFIYGGDCGDRYYGVVDVLDVNLQTWTRLAIQGSSPGVRAGHAAVNVGAKIYIIGGVGERHYYNDVWILDLCNGSWSQLAVGGKQPQGRFSHTAIATDSEIAIYGGCGEDEHPLNELVILQLGAEHLSRHYNIFPSKSLENRWKQERNSLKEETKGMTMFMGNKLELFRKEAREPESDLKQSFQFFSEISHPKRRRIINSKVWEVESEQEEHSLSLSQHSSPSQSDQELKSTDSATSSHGIHFLKQLNQSSTQLRPNSASCSPKELGNAVKTTPQAHRIFGFRNQQNQEKQLLHIAQRFGRQESQCPTAQEKQPFSAGPIQNLVGTEVQGRIDGVFDSGLLMTATVNGKVFRGVLFSPVAGSNPRVGIVSENSSFTAHQLPSSGALAISNNVELFRNSQRQHSVYPIPDSGHGLRQVEPRRVMPPVIRTQSSPSVKDAKLRGDLQGAFLTLGGPGSASG